MIEDLEAIVDALSSRSDFTDEFGSSAGNDFEALASSIRFGSTRNTRFGAFANRTAPDGAWDSGVFAYSPLERPSTAGLDERGGATYQGDAVAVDDMHRLYSGEITLDAAFSTNRISGTVNDLMDGDGNRWRYGSKSVKSMEFPRIDFLSDGTFMKDDTVITVKFTDDSRHETVSGSKFEGEFVDEGDEVLGTWRVGTQLASDLEGAFGASRGSASAVTGPTVADGGKVSLTSLESLPGTLDAQVTLDGESGDITITIQSGSSGSASPRP